MSGARQRISELLERRSEALEQLRKRTEEEVSSKRELVERMYSVIDPVFADAVRLLRQHHTKVKFKRGQEGATMTMVIHFGQEQLTLSATAELPDGIVFDLSPDRRRDAVSAVHLGRFRGLLGPTHLAVLAIGELNEERVWELVEKLVARLEEQST